MHNLMSSIEMLTRISYWLSFLLLVAELYLLGHGSRGADGRKKSLRNMGTSARLALLGFSHKARSGGLLKLLPWLPAALGPYPLPLKASS